MTLQLTLTPFGGAPVDVTPYLVAGQFQLGRSLGGEGARCSFSLVDFPDQVTMAELLATWSGQPVYRGQVVRCKRTGAADVTFIVPECVDAVTRMKRRHVIETYSGATADEIILDLLAKYMPEVTPAVTPLSAQLDITFNYASLYEAVRRVADAVGADWLLEPGNRFRFFAGSFDGPTVPEYGPEQILGDSFTDVVATAEFANRVWILGAKQPALGYKTQTYTGASDVFLLAYEPNDTEVRVNGELRSVSPKESADATTEFVVDKKRRVVEPRIALAPGDAVAIRYRPTIEVVDYFEDQASIQTYGLYERVIKDRTVTDKTSARQRGRAALRRVSVPRPVFSWQTDAMWDVYPGQRCRVVYPQWGIDQYCRLTDVDLSFQFVGHRWHVVASLTGEGL